MHTPRPIRAAAALSILWSAACSSAPDNPLPAVGSPTAAAASPTAIPTPATGTAAGAQNPGAPVDWVDLFDGSRAAAPPQDPRDQAKRDQENKVWNDAFGKLSAAEFATMFQAKAAAAAAEAERKNALDGFNFGTGIGATFDLHKGSRVSSASLVGDGNNGQIVRVDEESDVQVGLVLETHYFWTTSDKLVGYGPFFAIRTSDTEPVDEAGLGFMVGLRRSQDDTSSFNLGIGLMVDPDARVLADGFAPNLAPPAGADSIGYREEERFSLAILFSYTF